MAFFAVALLFFIYFAMTRWIVRPLDALRAAAERVTQGGRRLQLPRAGATELKELGVSLKRMTEKLVSDEEQLRRQVGEVERQSIEPRETQATLVRTERLASVGRLAAGLAHEIGNPLAAIMGLQDIMLGSDLSEAERRDFISRMQRETERIHGIIGDLLQFARPTQGGAQELRAPGRIDAAIEDTLTLLRPQKALQALRVDLELEPSLPSVVLSREQLEQILLNLLLNAVDACGAGGRIRISAVAEAAPGGGRQVRLSVEDSGPGVLESVRPRLFEPFVTSKAVGHGTGLGLAVCRGLLESVGGSIELEEARVPAGDADEGTRALTLRGARFVVLLPASDAG